MNEDGQMNEQRIDFTKNRFLLGIDLSKTTFPFITIR
jgi:hypothetical protein